MSYQVFDVSLICIFDLFFDVENTSVSVATRNDLVHCNHFQLTSLGSLSLYNIDMHATSKQFL